MTDIRIDRVKLGKISETAEGYLKGNAIVTRTGVFKYSNLDGTDRFELRDPKDILTNDSLETLKSLPITIDHPSELVNIDNADSLIVGMTGETVKIENDSFVGVSLNITHKDAIAQIKSGKQELSAGYRVDVVPEVGTYNGEKYTHRQTNVVYNHIALVDMGRAGPVARLNLDGAFVQCEEIKNEKEVMTTNKDTEGESLIETLAETVVKVTTGIDIQPLVEGVKEASMSIESVIESTETTSNTDSLESAIEKLRAENEALRNVNVDSLVAEKAKQRVLLLNKAASVMNTDGLIEKTDREIMESAIKSRLTSDSDFTDKSNDYVAGRFDSIIEDNQYRNIKKQMTNLDVKVQDKKPTSLFELMKLQHAGGK